MRLRADRLRTFCIGVGGLIVFPLGNFLLYGTTWAKGGGPTFFVIALETALSVAMGTLVCALLARAARSD